MFSLRRSAKFLIPVGLLAISLVLSSGATPAHAVKNTPTPTPTAADSGSGGSVGDASATEAATPADRMTLDLSSNDPQDVLSQLRTLNLIPQGDNLLQVQNLYVTARTKGSKYLPIFTDSSPSDLVLQFTVELNMEKDSAPGSGCGFFFRLSNKGYATVLLTVDHHLVLEQYKGKKALFSFDQLIDDLPGIDSSTYDIDPGTVHTVTIVAVGTSMSFFLDGVEIVTSQDAQSASGNIALLLYNVANTQVQNTCTYGYIWFDDLSNA
jgi:hypothetical protein